jgi:hypothetical protein
MSMTRYPQARRGSRDYQLRPSGGWDLDAMQWAVDEHGAGTLELSFLQAVNAGRVQCGGCHKAFRNADEVVLMVTWIAHGEPLEIHQHGYCLACADRHAEAITDEQGHGLAS